MADVRRALYEAASALMTRFKGRDKVRTWGLALAKRSRHRKATVAVARKLAVIMHAMWTDGTCYVGDAAASASERRSTRRHEGWQAAGSPGMSTRPIPSMLRSVILTAAN